MQSYCVHATALECVGSMCTHTTRPLHSSKRNPHRYRASNIPDSVPVIGVRKYVCCQLMSHRNPIEHVAKFLGHRNINTTFGMYWDATATELSEEMNIPWLRRASGLLND